MHQFKKNKAVGTLLAILLNQNKPESIERDEKVFMAKLLELGKSCWELIIVTDHPNKET